MLKAIGGNLYFQRLHRISILCMMQDWITVYRILYSNSTEVVHLSYKLTVMYVISDSLSKLEACR